MKRIGSRAQVYHGNAVQTSGGLKKKDLFKDKHGCIKSKKASARAKKNKNLGGLLKQKGSGCFDYKKKVKTQLGGGKNKKNVELEKHIFILSDGMQTFTLPNHYKNAKLNYKCKCPLNHLIKHNIGDHVEYLDHEMFSDDEMGFVFGEKCHFNNKQLSRKCNCGVVKKEHKIQDHKKSTKSKKKKSKSKKGGGFGKLFGKLANTGSKLASKGTAAAQKAAIASKKAAAAAKKIDVDQAINKFEKGVAKAELMANQAQMAADVATAGVQQVQGAAQQIGQAGQQVVGSVGALGHQLQQMPGQVVQPIMPGQQPQLLQQQPLLQQPLLRQPLQQMMMPRLMQQPRRFGGSKKKNSKKKSKSKKGGGFFKSSKQKYELLSPKNKKSKKKKSKNKKENDAIILTPKTIDHMKNKINELQNKSK